MSWYTLKMLKTPETSNDFFQIAAIHNKAVIPFLSIYSEEEKNDKGLFNETEESMIEMSHSRNIFCFEDKNNIVGYIAFRKKNNDTAWVSSLYIDPQSQGKGIGSELLKAVEIFAKEQGCIVVALETHKDATWALNFYEKNGYKIINDEISSYPYNKILDKPPVPNRPLLAKVL